MIVQEHGKYKDFKVAEPDPKTKIYGVRFSQRFFIPAEYDIILAFEPTWRANNIVSTGGKIRFKTMIQRELKDSDLLALNTKILLRPTVTEDPESNTDDTENNDPDSDTNDPDNSNSENTDNSNEK